MKSIIYGILIVALGLGIWALTKTKQEQAGAPAQNEEVAQTSSVLGCYVATLAKDVYTLSVQKQNGEYVSGTLG